MRIQKVRTKCLPQSDVMLIFAGYYLLKFNFITSPIERMNYNLNQIPDRTTKPRQKGLTMVMDKGLSLRQVEDFLEMGAGYTDIVKLGWATSYVTPNLKEKLALYKSAGIPVYFGGTLFEAFYIRGQFDEYRRVLDQYGMEYAEISDGSVEMESEVRC